MEFRHVSVLLHEMINVILTNPDGIYVDCTLGGGGHSLALSEYLSDKATIIGVDQDEDAIKAAGERLRGARCSFIPVRSNFSKIDEILTSLSIEVVDGFIFDLGVSSYQLDEGDRGFSYMHNGKLDMRMDQNQSLTAYEIVNFYDKEELSRIIHTYGEERWANRIASFICEKRKESFIETTEELVEIIKAAIPASARRTGPHPAKRTFQAIRIEVNNELSILEPTIKCCVNRLRSGGRVGIITFQSLEDRIIKRTFKSLAQGCICPPNLPICACHNKRIVRSIGKAIKPSRQELDVNSRARSAVLRVVEKI